MLSIYIGGGVEPESHYPQWKREYRNIERYTALNDSIAKLAEGTCTEHTVYLFTMILQRLMLLHEFIAYKKNNIILHAV